jgi:hypothetical protein
MNTQHKFFVSTSAGSGKTHAAIEYIKARPDESFLYISPTQQLCNQSYLLLRKAGRECREPIISDYTANVTAQALSALLSPIKSDGDCIVLSTKTFIAISSELKDKEIDYTVILDETFEPATFTQVNLGRNVHRERNLANFTRLFHICPNNGPLTVRNGMMEDARLAAKGDFSTSGDVPKSYVDLCQLIVDEANHVEITTDIDELLALGKGAIQTASSIRPDVFQGFKKLIFLSALFEKTMLYQLWTIHYGEEFKVDDDLKSMITYNTHTDYKGTLSIGYVLHPDDNLSKHTLDKGFVDGGKKPQASKTVWAEALRQTVEYFDGKDFLLHLNNDRVPSQSSVSRQIVSDNPNIKLLAGDSRGDNSYRNTDCILSLSAQNPTNAQADWLSKRLQVSKNEVYQMSRIHSVYQAICRTSIRDRSCTRGKVFIVGSEADANFLLDLFKGSKALGQITDLQSTKALGKVNKKPKADKLSERAGFDDWRARIDSANKQLNRSKASGCPERIARAEAELEKVKVGYEFWKVFSKP